MVWSKVLIFAGGVVAAGAVQLASKNESVHQGIVKVAAACLRAGDAVTSATQDVIDGANDLNAEARRQAKIDAIVKERMAEAEADIRADVEEQFDAEAVA